MSYRVLPFFIALLLFAAPAFAQGGWSMDIDIHQAGYQDTLVAFGTDSNATDSFDAGIDLPTPPTPAGGNWVRGYFSHPDWDVSTGTRFSQDIRANLDTVETKQWTLELRSTQTGTVMVDFQQPSMVLPDTVWATVQIDSEEYSLRDTSSFAIDFVEAASLLITVSNEPRAPHPFTLVSPEEEYSSPTADVNLLWESTMDPDMGDTVSYAVFVDTAGNFSSPVMSGLSDTSFTFTGMDNEYYFWTVQATGSDGATTWASDTLSFGIDVNDPPSSFDLLEPADGDTLSSIAATFRWQASHDPDMGQEVSYLAWVRMQMTDPANGIDIDTSMTIPGLMDTVLTLALPDSLDLPGWNVHPELTWSISAVSGGDTTQANQTWSLYLPTNPVSGVAEDNSGLPKRFAISKVYPNPFNPSVNIKIAVPKSSRVTATVYNVLGRRVATLANTRMRPGTHALHWVAHDPSGVYFLRVKNDQGWSAVRRLTLMK